MRELWIRLRGLLARARDTSLVTFLTWKRLSTVGNVQFLRISYVVLAIVPVVAWVQSVPFVSMFADVPLTMRLGYFASLVLSLAHMLYQGFCPQIIQRFESPNDLYRDLLQIKAFQSQYLPADKGFEFSIEHCRENFDRRNLENWGARLVCGALYGVGSVLFLWIALERSLLVLGICS